MSSVTGRHTFPPPTRGSVDGGARRRPGRGVPPAHAGISRTALRRRRSVSGSPRPRGDQSQSAASPRCRLGFPPPTRGSVGIRSAGFAPPLVPPAHAGISRRLPWTSMARGRSPRPRGDQSTGATARATPSWFPPPTRGSVDPGYCGAAGYASSPRPRGDQSRRQQLEPVRRRFPPPTRGSVVLKLAGGHRLGVPPAHAGISRRSPARGAVARRSPRPRGDQSAFVPSSWL